MAYGTIKVDTITFTDAGVDKSVTISGLVQNPTFSGNITVTGTVSGNTIRGQTVSGATITGGAAAFTTVTGGVATITSGVFALGSASNPSISFSGDANSGLYSPGADQVAISTNGTGRLFVDASGNVGINTASPANTLHLAKAANHGIRLERTGASPGVASWAVNTNGEAQLNADSGFTVSSASAFSTLLQLVSNGSERLRVTAGGLVGLGTSSPNTNLQIGSFANNQALALAAGTASTCAVYFADGTGADLYRGYVQYSHVDDSLQFGTSSTERMRLDSSGRLGLGTSSPSYLLHVSGSGAEIGLTDTAVANATWRLLAATGGATKLFRIYDSSNAADRFVIDSSGRVGIGTTSPAAGFGTGVVSLDVVGPIFARGPIATHQTNAGVLQYSAGTTLIRSYGATAATGEIAFNTGGGGGSPDTERARIDSSGRLLVGTSSARSIFNGTTSHSPLVQVEGASPSGGDQGRFISQVFGSSNNNDPIYIFARHASDSIGGITAVASNAQLGTVSFQGSDGSKFVPAAQITAAVDGTPGANDMPGRLIFATTADGAASPTERMRLDSSGRLGLGTSSPTAKLDVRSTALNTTSLTPAVLNQNVQIKVTGDTNNNITGNFISGISLGEPSNQCAAILAVDDGGFQAAGLCLVTGNSTAVAERLRIDSTGRVGIGTTSPATTLDVNGDVTITDKIIHGGDTNTAIRFPAADTVSVETGGSERARIDSSGRLLVGTSTARSNFFNSTGTAQLQVEGTNFSNSACSFTCNNSTAGEALNIFINKSAGSSVGSNTLVSSTDSIGGIQFQGNDGTEFVPCASITASIDGTPGANDMPGRLVFSTTADGASSPTERMRISSSGNVGIGTQTPDTALTILKNSNADFSSQANLRSSSLVTFDNSSQTTALVFKGAATGNADKYIFADQFGGTQNFGIGYLNGSTRVNSIACNQNDIITFNRSGAESVRIDSSGRLLVGTSSSTGSARAVFQGNSFSSGQPGIILIQRDTSSSGLTAGTAMGYIIFGDNVGSNYAVIGCEADGATGTNDYPSRLVFSTTADGASSPTERMRIKSNGQIDFGNTTNGAYTVTRNTGVVAYFDRRGTDGTIIEFEQDGTSEGSISVSGTTVSYNGAHLSRWSQLPGGAERTEILRGTVLSNIDEMCDWGEEDNEQLNRMKVSDVEGDKNVSGVFQAWDDDDTYTDDFYCAMTGDFIIRIAEGVTVQRGDLLMSAGDGTAKPQDDDIIRSKTIAKVTSTHVTCTYDDGSYCVPCVLMAC
jgi:hypothetical protein